jgi:hypothetical protein
MTDRDYELDRRAKQPSHARRTGIRRLVAIAVAIAAAIAIMYGESWAIERAPASNVASGLAQTADLKRALDNVLTALGTASSIEAF